MRKTDDASVSEIVYANDRPIAMSANYYFLEHRLTLIVEIERMDDTLRYKKQISTKDHTVTRKAELAKQVFLLTVCLSGAYLYVEPAKAYANRMGQPGLAWLYIISTCFPSIAVLYVATDTFFKLHFAANIPRVLKDVLVNPKTSVNRYIENFVIAAFSLVSSIPLASVLFAFHPKTMPEWAVILLALVILIDNTVLHFLPVKLVLNERIYRLPILPIECLVKWLWAKCRDYKLDELTKHKRALDIQKTKDWTDLKTLMKQRVTSAQQRLMQASFTWKWYLQYEVKPPEKFRGLAYADDPLKKVLAFLPEKQAAVGDFCKFLGKLNKLLLKGVSLLGAIWIWACCMGYYAAPVNQFQQWINPYVNSTAISYTAAAGISALPIYSISVLLTFFGGIFSGGIYTYLTTWGKNVTKIPMEVKLFPKLFIAAMVLNGVFAGFSYAAAAELVYSNFTAKWAQSFFVPFFVGAAISGIIFLGFAATRDFFMLMFLKMATHLSGKYTRFLCLGGKDMRRVVKLNEKIEQYKNSIDYMDGAQMEAELTGMTPERRQMVLGIEDVTYNKIIGHDANLKAYGSNNHWWSCFCCCKNGETDTKAEDTELQGLII